MKKSIILLSICFLLFISAPAVADTGSWYVSGDVGQSHYSEGDIAPTISCSYFPCATFSGVKLNNTGFQVTGGYQFNSVWGLEAGYVQLGEADVTVLTRVPLSQKTAYQFKIHGWVIEGTWSYSFSNSWSVTGRLGTVNGHVEADSQGNGFANGSASVSTTNWRGTAGLSLNWQLSDDWTLRLGFDHYRRLGDTSTTGQYSVNATGIGVTYFFH